MTEIKIGNFRANVIKNQHGEVMVAWPCGYTQEDAPIVVKALGTTQRPYIVFTKEGIKSKSNGIALHYASWVSAIKRNMK